MLRRFCLPVVCVCWATEIAWADARIDFERDIQPLLVVKCIRCHGPRKQEGGLRLDVRQRAMRGGDSGPAIVPGDPATSELHRRVVAGGDQRMPPSGPGLTDAQKDQLRLWIVQKAPWPDKLAGQEDLHKHWAFRSVQAPVPPVAGPGPHVRSAIDAFLLARLEAKGLSFSPEASKTTLLRRLYLDLIGLSPTPAALQEFLDDVRPDAYERQVDRLLASPHFGERWGRHWLDLARFAESDGYENDNLRPNAWRFRDWVVEAINSDLSFDRITIEQLAGDLLPGATVGQKIASGFHRHTLWNSAASADKEEYRTLAIKDRADTTAAAWMGLTLGCAKCHSHKYDPISQREYYQLYAFFNNTDNRDLPIPGGRIMTLAAAQRKTHVHKRGSFLSKGDEVKPDVPGFLPPLPALAAKKVVDRLDLARWLVDARHPLTARVAVNRFWQHLFGQGLVTTPENFGVNGQPPSHPELLDWLAAEFFRLKWSRKALIRSIVTSAAYRQSSVHRDEVAKIDPGNLLVGRQNRFRLEAEIIRDLALDAGGLLDCRLGGPSIVPPYPEGFLAQRFSNEALKLPTKQHHRRSIYIHVQRTLTHPLLAVFDAADGNQPCLRRDRSTTPMQALTLLNDPVFVECAQALGGRIRLAAGTRDERLRFAFQSCTGRPPGDREMPVLRELFDALAATGAGDEAVWTSVARALLNLEQVIMRE